MKPKILFCLALGLFGLFASGHVARADVGTYDSVEWMTAMADEVGVYHAERIYGPYSVTNGSLGVSCCSCTAGFKLQKSLRGNPPVTFSRTRSVGKPELLGFH